MRQRSATSRLARPLLSAALGLAGDVGCGKRTRGVSGQRQLGEGMGWGEGRRVGLRPNRWPGEFGLGHVHM